MLEKNVLEHEFNLQEIELVASWGAYGTNILGTRKQAGWD